MKLFLQLLANGLVTGALYAMLAVGFGIVWRSLRVFHVAYGATFILCAYCFYGLVSRVGMHPAIAFPLTLLFGAGTGWLMETSFYGPFQQRHASSGSVFVGSLGMFIALENLVAMIFGNELQTVSRGVARTLRVGPVLLTELQLLEFGLGAIVVLVVWILVCKLRVFKALWAMGDQPELIAVLGLPVHQLRRLAMVGSGTIVAVPACLVCFDIGADPHSGMSYLLVAAVAVLVGGGNSYSGWVWGGVLLAVLQSLAMWKLSARWMDLATFSLLIVMLVFRPRGLLDQSKRLEEFA